MKNIIITLLFVNFAISDDEIPNLFQDPPITLNYMEIAHAQLPDGVSGFTETQEQGKAIKIAYFDLNGDGNDEIIVKHQVGATAGPYTDIYTKKDLKYQKIMGFNGFNLSIVGPNKEGNFPVLTYWSRGGGGNMTKVVSSYSKDEYKDIMYFRVENGKLIAIDSPRDN